ncbi:MAG: HNH endonuclease family protein, partial [Alphaproteobacteria bacterium]|nr:HNH endonuclease family protein [Alphaproteobacteria bacterium]
RCIRDSTDGDCQNTRHEVLRRQSLVAVTLDARGCRVLAGLWLDPYTGQHHTDPSLLDIDHLVPLAEAHQSGGDKWNARRRARFANDLATPGALVAVARGVNRSKGMRDPGRWLPDVGRCDYVKHWLAVKAAYDLALDPQEAAAIQQVRETDCRG